MSFPHGSDSKESACNEGDLGLIPGLGRSPGEANGYTLQYSCSENPMVWLCVPGCAYVCTRVEREKGRDLRCADIPQTPSTLQLCASPWTSLSTWAAGHLEPFQNSFIPPTCHQGLGRAYVCLRN